MSTDTAIPGAEEVGTPHGVASRTSPRVPPIAFALLAAAWVVPLLTHLLRADVVLLRVLVVATASLLTLGSTLFDRLFLAAVLLATASIPAGLLFSVWPWGLNPVPVAGGTLTVLIVAGVVLRRSPALPRRLQ